MKASIAVGDSLKKKPGRNSKISGALSAVAILCIEANDSSR